MGKKAKVGFGVAGSLMNIVISNQITASKGKYAVKQSEKLAEIYEKNSKELVETYEKNWYKRNFHFIDQRTKIIREATKHESDFVAKMGMIDLANNVSGGSFLSDARNKIIEKGEQEIEKLDFNKEQEDKANVEQMNMATLNLAEKLVEQSNALSDNYKQVLEQDKANTILQLTNAGALLGEYYVDQYYTEGPKTKKSSGLDKLTLGGKK